MVQVGSYSTFRPLRIGLGAIALLLSNGTRLIQGLLIQRCPRVSVNGPNAPRTLIDRIVAELSPHFGATGQQMPRTAPQEPPIPMLSLGPPTPTPTFSNSILCQSLLGHTFEAAK